MQKAKESLQKYYLSLILCSTCMQYVLEIWSTGLYLLEMPVGSPGS